MKKLLATLLVVIFVGCVTKPIVLPDGSQGYAIECKNSLAGCYKKASKLCPKGYDILETDKIGNSSAAVAGAYGAAESNVTISRLVKCRAIAGNVGH